MLTPAERVAICLKGGHADKVPFTMYGCPQNAVEREMRNRGLCLNDRGGPIANTYFKTVHMHRTVEWDQKLTKRMVRTIYDTPVGTVTTLHNEGGGPGYMHEKMFKTPDDFKTILYILKDTVVEAVTDFSGWQAKKDYWGGDAYITTGAGVEPLQLFISEYYIGMEDFCIQWMDNRDEILKLYNAQIEINRQFYPILAKSPATIANFGGNLITSLISRDEYEQYYMPHYAEAASHVAKKGILLSSHYDGNCGTHRDLIAKSKLSCIEAFTPAPDTDMTLREARDAWPDKILWLNFPSSVHLRPDAEVEQFTVDMLNTLESVDGIIMGITEDLPAHRGLDSCLAVMKGLERHAKERPEFYR
jgi:hypothetical protein